MKSILEMYNCRLFLHICIKYGLMFFVLGFCRGSSLNISVAGWSVVVSGQVPGWRIFFVRSGSDFGLILSKNFGSGRVQPDLFRALVQEHPVSVYFGHWNYRLNALKLRNFYSYNLRKIYEFFYTSL